MIMMTEPEGLGRLVKIKGVHIDDLKGKPVEGVTVSCENIENGHILTGISDENGDVTLVEQ